MSTAFGRPQTYFRRKRKRTPAQLEVGQSWYNAVVRHAVRAEPKPAGTAFERVVASLGLTDREAMQQSEALRLWVSKHAAQKYIPEWLLAWWGFDERKVLSDCWF